MTLFESIGNLGKINSSSKVYSQSILTNGSQIAIQSKDIVVKSGYSKIVKGCIMVADGLSEFW